MRKHTLLFLTVGLIIVGLLASACQPSRRPVPTEAGGLPAATESPGQEAQETEPAGGEAAPETEAPPSGSEIPEDVPIPIRSTSCRSRVKAVLFNTKLTGRSRMW